MNTINQYLEFELEQELEQELLINLLNSINTIEYTKNIDKYKEYSIKNKKNTILLIQMIILNLSENSDINKLNIYLYKLLDHNKETYYNLVNCEKFKILYKQQCNTNI